MDWRHGVTRNMWMLMLAPSLDPSWRIGFCCVWIEPQRDPWEQRIDEAATIKPSGLQLTSFQKLTRKEQQKKLHQVVARNMQYTVDLVRRTRMKPPIGRMVRLSSQLLPLHDHPDFVKLYDDAALIRLIERRLAEAGRIAKRGKVRLSFHPDQYCVLNNPRTMASAVRQIESHRYCLELLGIDSTEWHDRGAAINVHVGGKAGGLLGFKRGFRRLSQASKNLLTVENDEFSYGLADTVKLARMVALVPDIHHHWIKTGCYLDPNNVLLDLVKASWRGQRPKMHLSISPWQLVLPKELHPRDEFAFTYYHPGMHYGDLPNLKALLERGLTKAQLRQHGGSYWHLGFVDWTLQFLPHCDLLCECKTKNYGQSQLIDRADTLYGSAV